MRSYAPIIDELSKHLGPMQIAISFSTSVRGRTSRRRQAAE